MKPLLVNEWIIIQQIACPPQMPELRQAGFTVFARQHRPGNYGMNSGIILSTFILKFEAIGNLISFRMKPQNILIAHPSNDQEMNTIMAFFKALKIKFEVAKDTPYDTDFVAKIESGREDYRKGKGTIISMDELNDLCK